MDKNLLLQSLNLAPAKHELSVPANGDLTLALNNPKVLNLPLEALKQTLRGIIVKIGLRAANWPNDMEKAILINHILKEYGNHTLEEIKLAFDMAIAGKLEVEVNCYENFSCLYFSNIMNAYRDWAKQEIKYVSRETPEQKVYTDEEILNQRRGEIETFYQALRKGYLPILHIYFEEVLIKDNLLNEGENVEQFFVRKLNSQAENIYICNMQ